MQNRGVATGACWSERCRAGGSSGSLFNHTPYEAATTYLLLGPSSVTCIEDWLAEKFPSYPNP